MQNLLARDLDYIIGQTQGLWEELRGRQVFITGGTGFFGCWLLESFTRANQCLSLGAKALVLTRDPQAFKLKAPHLAQHPAVGFHTGDVRDFQSPQGEFSHIIHAAGEDNPQMSEEGARHTLDFALKCKAKKFLLTSSGAVYGSQPPEIERMPETYSVPGRPGEWKYAYGQGKRLAESLCLLYGQRHGLEVKIARCFTFIGPYLPLEAHFAAGNFLRDALKGGPIVINGDGRPLRSYMYAADLAVWLWSILFNGRASEAYNVGSDEEISILGLAQAIAAGFTPRPEIKISQPVDNARPTERYVPSVEKAKAELKLSQWISLPDAVARTISFLRKKNKI